MTQKAKIFKDGLDDGTCFIFDYEEMEWLLPYSFEDENGETNIEVGEKGAMSEVCALDIAEDLCESNCMPYYVLKLVKSFIPKVEELAK